MFHVSPLLLMCKMFRNSIDFSSTPGKGKNDFNESELCDQDTSSAMAR